MRGTGVSSGGSRACGGATGAPSQPPPSVPSLWEALARTRGRRPRWRRRRRSGGQTSRPPRRRCPIIWACASLAGRGSRAFPRTGESGSWPGRRSSARSGERAPRAGKHSPRLVRAQPEAGPGRDESFQVTSAHCAGADHKSHIPPTIIRSISALKSAFLLVRIAAARILREDGEETAKREHLQDLAGPAHDCSPGGGARGEHLPAAACRPLALSRSCGGSCLRTLGPGTGTSGSGGAWVLWLCGTWLVGVPLRLPLRLATRVEVSLSQR